MDQERRLPTQFELDENQVFARLKTKLPNDPLLDEFSSYIISSPAIRRCAHLVSRTHENASFFQGAQVLDIGGGQIGYADSYTGDLSYFPWYSVATSLLGATAINIDRDSYALSQLSLDHLTPALYDRLQRIYTLIPANLAIDLLTPNGLVDTLTRRVPHLVGTVDVVNCQHLVSQGIDPFVNAPSFLRSLGLKTTAYGAPKSDAVSNNRLTRASGEIIRTALTMLRNRGYLHFNTEVFQKRGDTLVWIPGDIHYDLELHRSLFRKPAQDPYGRPMATEGTYFGTGGLGFVVRNGVFEVSFTGHSSLEPIP